MADTTTIQQKIEDLIDYSDERVWKFPKFYRFSIGQDIMRYLYQELELAVTANKKYFKKTTLQDLDVANAVVQSLVRRALNTKYVDRSGATRHLIDEHHYEVWSGKLQEIGRMIGGWIKSQQAAK